MSNPGKGAIPARLVSTSKIELQLAIVSLNDQMRATYERIAALERFATLASNALADLGAKIKPEESRDSTEGQDG